MQRSASAEDIINGLHAKVLLSEYQEMVVSLSGPIESQQKITEITVEILSILYQFAFRPIECVLNRDWMRINPTIIAELRGAVLAGSYENLLQATLKDLKVKKENIIEFSAFSDNKTLNNLRQQMQIVWTFSRFGIQVTKIEIKITEYYLNN